MKTTLTLLLLFLCTLMGVAQETEDDQHWTDDAVLTAVSIGKAADSPDDVLVNEEITEYTIKTAKGLAWIAKVTNAKLIKGSGPGEDLYYPAKAGFEDRTVKLGTIEGGKLDISAHKWVPIGKGDGWFNGTLDGNNQEVTGLRIEEEVDEKTYSFGLFGNISNASIKDLGLQIKTFTIKEKEENSSTSIFVGGIAGQSGASTIKKCYVYGLESTAIQTNNINSCNIGGLVGGLFRTNSIITNCYSMIDIIGESNRKNWIGSIVGQTDGKLSNSFATGCIKINSPGQASIIGGICGFSDNATIENNLALNKGGIIIEDGGSYTHHVARIGGYTNSKYVNNYASPNFTITGQDVIDDEDADGTTLDTSVDIAKILNGGDSGDDAWAISETTGLPYLKSFTSVEQPATDVVNKGLVIPRLKLDDAYAQDGKIYINYDNDNKQWKYIDAAIRGQFFNGEVSGEDIQSRVEIRVGTDVTNAPTLTIVDDLGITNANGYGMYIDGSVNLNVAVGKKVNISGDIGLYIKGNVSLNQPKQESREIANEEIMITGTKFYGIKNYGIFDINVDKLTVEGKGASETGIFNAKTLNCNTKLITIKGKNGIENKQDATFNINNAEVTIEQDNNKAIMNKGAFNLNEYGTLSIFTDEGVDPIMVNSEGSTFTIQSGATFRTGVKNKDLPAAYPLTYSNPSGETLSITDNNGIDLPTGVNIGTGTPLLAEASNNNNAIMTISYKNANGSGDPTTIPESNGLYAFTMPAYATTVSVSYKEDEPTPTPPDPDDDDDDPYYPTVYHTVTLPTVEGATLDPGAGDYDIESWSTFRFYLTLDPEYDQSQPIVTTSRGETLQPRSSDGAYVIKYVRSDVTVRIDGLVKNPDPVANVPTDADAITIRCTADGLLLHVPSPETATIHTFSGTLLRTIDLPAGDTRLALPAGTYIVRVGTKVQKVILW